MKQETLGVVIFLLIFLQILMYPILGSIFEITSVVCRSLVFMVRAVIVPGDFKRVD